MPACPDETSATKRTSRRFSRLDLTPTRGLMLEAAEAKACQFFEIYSDRSHRPDHVVVDDRDYGFDAEKENTLEDLLTRGLALEGERHGNTIARAVSPELDVGADLAKQQDTLLSPSKARPWFAESPRAATGEPRKLLPPDGDSDQVLPRAGSELQLLLMRRRSAIEAATDPSGCPDGLGSPGSRGLGNSSPWGARIPEDAVAASGNHCAPWKDSPGFAGGAQRDIEEKGALLEHQALALGRKASEFARLLSELRTAAAAEGPRPATSPCSGHGQGWSPLSTGKAEAEPRADGEVRKRKEEEKALRSQISKLNYENRKLQEAKERSEKALQQAQFNANAELQKCQSELGDQRLENQRLSQVVKQLEAEIVRLGSHSNPKQKIHYLQQVKEENTVLRKELDRAKRLLGRQRSGCSTPRSPEEACKQSASACSTPSTPGFNQQLRCRPQHIAD